MPGGSAAGNAAQFAAAAEAVWDSGHEQESDFMDFHHDDLYHDHTWFDVLGARLMQRCQRHLPRNQAQLWTAGFTLFAGLCVAWAAGLATQCVVFDLPRNQCLAQLLAASLLLVAARHFLAATGMSAAGALTRRKLVRRTQPLAQPSAPITRPVSRSVSGHTADPQQFFRAVKGAGINVRIAQALYRAGFRTGEQVRTCADARLLAIPGIGHATLRKLRLQFGLPQTESRIESRPQSNAA